MKLLLFSGGVDLTCIARWQSPDILVTIDYGQICARGELRASANLAQHLGIRHEVVRANIGHLGAGDLAGVAPVSEAGASETWPLRNQFLVTVAVMRFARDGVNEVQIGTLATDVAHPDGRKEFVDKLSELVQLQEPNIKVTAPAIGMDVRELVKVSGVERDLLGWTFSCHVADVPCGKCRGCSKTLELFRNDLQFG